MSYPPPPPQMQQPMEQQRDPCPDRILDDIGGAFAMGAIGGGAWHLVKGLRNSPSGYRFKGALEALRRESPRLGGSFANWGLTFSMFDCSCQYIRKKEDPWNAIMAGAATGGFLQLRFGLKSAAKSAAFGGFLLAMIEGLSIALVKISSPPPPGQPNMYPPGMPGPPPGMEAPAAGAAAPGDGGGGLWSFFGGGGSETQKSGGGETTVFTDDPFKAPDLPKEFQDQASGSGGFQPR